MRCQCLICRSCGYSACGTLPTQMRFKSASIVRAEPSDLDVVTHDLAAAFAEYPLARWIWPRPATRELLCRRLIRTFLSRVGFPQGIVYRAETGGAVAVWFPSESLTPSLRDDTSLLRDTTWQQPPLAVLRLVRTYHAMRKHHDLATPHYYLSLIGVRPHLQRCGIGSRLLEVTLNRCDEHQRGAFLETSDESLRAWYSRFHFHDVDRYWVVPGQGLTWTMWRPPQ